VNHRISEGNILKFQDIPLDDREKLGELIILLTSLYESGFSISSSPLTPILETITDLLLQLARFFDEGGPLTERTNPEIKEAEDIYNVGSDDWFKKPKVADALGNPKMVKSFGRPKWQREDSEKANYFRWMASNFVEFKRSGRIESFFMKEQLYTGRVGPIIFKEKKIKVPKTQQKGKQKAIKNYFQRRQQRPGQRYKK